MSQSLGLNRILGGAIGVIALVSVLSSGWVLVTAEQLRDATDARSRSNQLIRGSTASGRRCSIRRPGCAGI